MCVFVYVCVACNVDLGCVMSRDVVDLLLCLLADGIDARRDSVFGVFYFYASLFNYFRYMKCLLSILVF